MLIKNKYRKFYTSQVDERDCGVAALSMVLKFYGSQYPLFELRKKARTDINGTTVLGIMDASKNIGIKAEAFKLDMSVFDISEIRYPFIISIIKNKEDYHYYTVFASSNDYVVIGDPADKIKKISKKELKDEWSGIGIFFEPASDYKVSKKSNNSFKHYFHLIKNENNLITKIVILSFLTTFIGIASSYFFQILFDNIIPQKDYSFLEIISIGLIIGYLFNSLFLYFQGVTVTKLGKRFAYSINMDYIDHLFHLPVSFFSDRRTGEITSRFTDASNIIDALGSTIVSVFIDFFMIVIIGTFLFYQNHLLFAVSIIAVPIYALIVITLNKRFDRLSQEAMEKASLVNADIIENVKGIDTIKSFNNENYSINNIKESFSDVLNKNLSYAKVNSLQKSLREGVDSILHVMVLAIGAQMVITGKMLIGQLLTYNMLLTYLTSPILDILNLQPKIRRAKVADNRLNEVFLTPIENTEENLVSDKSKIDGDVSIQNLSFRYGYGPLILDKINLLIKRNEKIVIVGMSGSGKTTLAKLLVDFLDIPEGNGEIRLNDISIRNINNKTLRDYIVYVPQEPYLFKGTIYENLVFDNSDGLKEVDIERATSIAQINNDIKKLPLGYSTELSESGVSFSGGQKQRIAIARALLTPAKVIILDESTSNLDSITESRIINSLIGIKDRTIIFIAHRLSIAEKVNNIVVLDHGKIVERGSHDNLLKRKSVYYNLQKYNSTE